MTFEEKRQALRALLENDPQAMEKFKAVGADKEALVALAKEYGIELAAGAGPSQSETAYRA